MVKQKNLFIKIITIFLITLLISSFFSFVNAEETTTVESLTEGVTEIVEEQDIEEEALLPERVNSDVYLIESNVVVDYPISGNLFIMAQQVTIDSTIDGNCFILAEKVTFTSNSYIYTDAYIAAKDVDMSGYVYDLYCAAGNINLGDGFYAIRDVYLSADTIAINGYIKRNAYIGCSNLSLPDKKFVIGGDLHYSAESDISEDSVTGNVFRTAIEKEESSISITSYIKSLISALIYALVITLIIVFALKDFSNNVLDVVKTHPWKSLLFGLLLLICMPIASIVLLCTVIGIPLSLALIALYVLMLSISLTVSGIVISKFICDKKNIEETPKKFIPITLGVVAVLWILTQLPIIGTLVSLLKNLLGFGAIFMYVCSKCSKDDKKATKGNKK